MMERRMHWKVHVRCESGENLEIVSKSYLSIYPYTSPEINQQAQSLLKQSISVLNGVIGRKYSDAANAGTFTGQPPSSDGSF